LKHHYIGTEHILLGLMREEEGLAFRVLESLDITIEEVRVQVVRIRGQGDDVPSGQIPFTPDGKKVLELSLREAISLGHHYIGTEHILLGLARVTKAVGARILMDFDADYEKIRNEVLRMLSAPDPKRPRDPEPPNIRFAPFAYGPSVEELARLRQEMQQALETGDTERASELRERVNQLEQIEAKVAAAAAASFPLYTTPEAPEHWEEFVKRQRQTWLLIGWALFGVALALGILVGWLIWG